MRPIILSSTVAAFLFFSYGCAGAQSESLDLSDRIVEAATTLKRSGQPSVEIAYILRADAPSLIAVIPTGGVDKTGLPDDAAEQQVSGLIDSAEAWKGQAFLAIAWPNGTSTGPTIGRHVSVPRQLSVLKPAKGTITIRLERDSTGTVSVSDLR